MHGELGDAVRRLREAFADYPARPVLEGCPHCRGTVVVADEDLFNLSLRLGNTVGTYADLKSYLPAMLEDLATGGDLDESIVLGRLHDRPGWETWPDAEREAITAYLHTVWRVLLSAYPARAGAFRDSYTFLRAMNGLYPDIGPFLREWDAVRTPDADRHLAAFVDSWTYRQDFPAAAVTWMRLPEVRDRLFQAFIADPDGPAADEYASAYDLLD